jgi:predicted phage baseplate assembly protein
MTLPTPNLDDLRFQKDLVDEARRRIIRYCPEWTDYNLSDPGITLIELFAWMTESIVYRLNRVPDKNYVKFMEMLGVRLYPASSARTELTFWLSAPFPLNPEDDTVAVVPQGTEVSTRRAEEEAEVTFTTDERLVIAPPRLAQLRREADFNRNYLPRLGVEDFYAFDRMSPKVGDTFYLGFDETQTLGGYILALTFECREVQAVGVRREDPPLVWECSMGDGRWQEVPLSTRRGEKDTTGGLNNSRGRLVLYLPLEMRPNLVHGRSAYWVRCRLQQRRKEQGMYTESPRITDVKAHTLGATTRATHAVIARDEVLGHSDGEPGQVFSLRHAPVLAVRDGETVQVQEERDGEDVFVAWEIAQGFAASTRYDRHVSLDTASGEVRFGPSIRQPDGTVRQYGRVPEAGRAIRFTQYRYGGGVGGNLPADRLQVLRSALPYVDRVSNLVPADGGRDQETLEEAKLRAARELRAQHRAVTAEEYENLARGASRSVARARCMTPGDGPGAPPPGTVELLIVPAVHDSLRAGDLGRLQVEPQLRRDLVAHLDRYRLLTTNLHVREPSYLGVRVHVEIVPAELSRPDLVRDRVAAKLREFIAPLALAPDGQDTDGAMGPEWEGWPFGRDLYVAEVYSLIQQVQGVKHVLDVQLYQRTVIPAHEAAAREAEMEAEEQAGPAWVTVEGKVMRVPEDALLCSFDHEIQLVEL